MEYELKNLSSKQAVVFRDDAVQDYFVKELDWGQVQATHNTTPYINLLGSHINATVMGERDVSISGYVSADNLEEMRRKKQVLNKLVNPLDNLSISQGEYELIVRPDTSIVYSTNKQENNWLLCQFLIQATAYIPFFTLRRRHVVTDSRVTGVPLFPLVLPEGKGKPFGIIPGETVRNIHNTGDVPCGFVVQFTATGPANNPRITNNLTGDHIEVAVSLTLGDALEVSTVTGDKYIKLIRGGQETDAFHLLTTSSRMDTTLSVGVNDLTIDAEGNAANVIATITYTPYFLEVQ